MWDELHDILGEATIKPIVPQKGKEIHDYGKKRVINTQHGNIELCWLLLCRVLGGRRRKVAYEAEKEWHVKTKIQGRRPVKATEKADLVLVLSPRYDNPF